MEKTLKEIAKVVNGFLTGNGDLRIRGVAGIKEAKEGEITFLDAPRPGKEISATRASAIVLPLEIEPSSLPCIRVPNPRLAVAKILALFHPQAPGFPAGIDERAGVHPTARIARDVAIGPFVMIEKGVVIGAKTVVYPFTHIGKESKIGKGCLIYSNVIIREGTKIGSDVIIHSGTVIGSDGFGFVRDGKIHHKIPQVGTVEIQDRVEIGSNVSIDRATMGRTIIGEGTKIDNLVQIAHNVEIGKNCIIVAQSGIAGSSKIGDRVTIAGQVGITDHVEVGSDTIIAARSGVTKSLPAGGIFSGFPARSHKQTKRLEAQLRLLPQIREELQNLKKEFKK